MKNIEVFKVSNSLSSLLVNIEIQLKTEPNISLADFCNNQRIDPLKLLYSHGFQSLIAISALLPLKELLSSEDMPNNWGKLRIARNSLCHGTYKVNDDGSIFFKDRDKELILTPSEIVELSNRAYDVYAKKQS